jgi:hypothetical protein
MRIPDQSPSARNFPTYGAFSLPLAPLETLANGGNNSVSHMSLHVPQQKGKLLICNIAAYHLEIIPLNNHKYWADNKKKGMYVRKKQYLCSPIIGEGLRIPVGVV